MRLHLYSAESEILLTTCAPRTVTITCEYLNSTSAGLQAIKNWYDVFFTVPVAEFGGFATSMYSQLIRCTTTLYRIISRDDFCWASCSVWTAPEVLSVLDHVIIQLDAAFAMASSGSAEENPFCRAAHMFRSMRADWDKQLSLQQSPNDPVPSSFNAASLESMGIEFFDNDWVMDLLIPPPY